MKKTKDRLLLSTLLISILFIFILLSGFASNAAAPSNANSVRLGFAGDMNLDENWATTQYLDKQSHGIYDCISPNLIKLCNGFDLFMINNEFSYSNRGTPLSGKKYTFRANPTRVQALQALGTDLVLLHHNHIYDYGEEAFQDTLTTLQNAKIDYVGAGLNDTDACRPVYYEYDGLKIAYVAATRAEKYILTPEATATTSGVLRAYDPAKYLQVIQTAKANSDYVIASIHWGTEYSNQAEQYQRDLGHAMINAGADAVIGSHTHVLQGLEYYHGKPIVYSLGNFWFNEKNLYSCVVELNVNKQTKTLDGMRFIPCIQKNCSTSWPADATECRKIMDFEEGISFGIQIDNDGYVINRSIEPRK
ncbi:MAG: CapA family protein [Lachnospiraceae bacterium]|nr:CapA family protein [Lachnospiraceae bacterium]